LIQLFWQPLVHDLFAPGTTAPAHFVFLATQPTAHATPFPGAKQLANAASYCAWQVAAVPVALHAFCVAAACLMHAAVAAL